NAKAKAIVDEIVAMEKGLEELKSRKPLRPPAAMPSANVQTAGKTLSNFERVFLMPFVLRWRRTTEVAACKTVHVVELSFGDWTARILLTILTAGIIWLCAYFVAKRRMSSNGSVLWKFLHAPDLRVAAKQKLIQRSNDIELSNLSVFDGLGKVAEYLFGSTADVYSAMGILLDIRKSLACSGMGILDMQSAFFGSDRKFHPISAESLCVKADDGRSRDDVCRDLCAALNRVDSLALCHDVDPLGKDREIWNWFIENIINCAAAEGALMRIYCVMCSLAGTISQSISCKPVKCFEDCAIGCAAATAAEVAKTEAPAGVEAAKWKKMQEADLKGIITDAITGDDGFDQHQCNVETRFFVKLVAMYFRIDPFIPPASNGAFVQECSSAIAYAFNGDEDANIDEAAAQCMAKKICAIAAPIFQRMLGDAVNDKGENCYAIACEKLDATAVSAVSGKIHFLMSVVDDIPQLNSMYHEKVPKHILSRIEVSP
ncbi:MAG: hypothetical protein LBB38_00850, partial [Puniceicoccales bacterium]|nr:hypothetical protein [Puniceicoccales bacterium]